LGGPVPDTKPVKNFSHLFVLFRRLNVGRQNHKGRPQLFSWSDFNTFIATECPSIPMAEYRILKAMDVAFVSAANREISDIQQREIKRG
jgi:hypothetical protein